jgi:tetratricopeptide (TPR) repeat protein
LREGGVINVSSTAGVSTIETVREGKAEFDNLVTGRYSVQVIATEYQRATEAVEIGESSQHIQISVTLKAETSAKDSNLPASQSVLPPKAGKDLNSALEAIRTKKTKNAREHLEKVAKRDAAAAVANPDVSYLWGLYYAENKDWTQATRYWEHALEIYPRHAFSLAALGEAAFRNGDVLAATGYFSRAVEAEPSSWRYEEHLAEAHLRLRDYEQARQHGERAIELGKSRAREAQLILAQALIYVHDYGRALKALDTFLAEEPSGSAATEARHMIERINDSSSSTIQNPESFAALEHSLIHPTSLVEDLMPGSNWMPRDVDESMPAVEPGISCPWQKVQREVGERERDFVGAVNRISATESLMNEEVNPSGYPAKRETLTYSYAANFEQARPDMLDVEEYRNGTVDLSVFPDHVATLGLTSLALIFHPLFQEDYEMTCEGLSRGNGQLAWQVHFRQRPEKPTRMRGYEVNGRLFPVALRGRAWIAVETYQVINLETDIVSPVREIRLRAEHSSVSYQPIRFRTRDQQLWLPNSADLFFDFRGHRRHRRHHFTHYMLFSVDERQQISVPTVQPDVDADASTAISREKF